MQSFVTTVMSFVVGGLHNEASVSPIFTNFLSYKTVLNNVHRLTQVLLVSPCDVWVYNWYNNYKV